MEQYDKDLQSIQEVRCLVDVAKEAQDKLAVFTQEQIDKIVEAIAKTGYEHAEILGKMAHEETSFGCSEDKIIKNQFGSMGVYDSIKNMKTVGIINEDEEAQTLEVAVPMGVVAGLIPSTNPTSTVLYKAQIAIKSGNAIIFSPHPGAKKSILETVRLIQEAAEKVGCPKGAIGCIETLSVNGTSELMRLSDLILATGGTAMVKAAYSSGTPAIGVGPGNGPAFIEKTADIRLAVKRILDSKTFDNGTICASEQSIVTEDCIKEEVVAELLRQGAYFLNDFEKEKVSSVLMRANGTMNPKIVGKSATTIAKFAGISVPNNTRVLIAKETEVGNAYPFSKEKLCPVLAFYIEKNAEAACEKSIKILNHEGAGHTFIIHSNDKDLVRHFALHKPASRILVNVPGALGGIGAATNLNPALTLGCGAIGGSSTSDNINPMNLLNIRRMAYGVKELEDLKAPNLVNTKVEKDDMQQVITKVLERLGY